MKTKNKALFLAVITIISFSILFTSCDDDDNGDTTRPTIKLITPEEGAVLELGSNLNLEVEFSDNENLASYKVNIHDNFDGHTHKSTLRSDQDETVDFSYQKSWTLAGDKNIKVSHQEIAIPENATPGEYHLIVYCIDAAGNESYVARGIILGHDDEDDHDHEH